MEVYDYVVTKPELNDDTLAHFLGGAHKYLNKYMGKNGKWVYVYNRGKSKAQEILAKQKRKKMKIGSYSIFTNGNKIGVNNDVRVFGAHNISSQSGRAGSRLNAGIEAGRKRAKKKATIDKFTKRQLQKAFPSGGKNAGYGKEYVTSFRTKVAKSRKDPFGFGGDQYDAKYFRNPRAGSTRGQGYSSSIGSADNNKATNTALKARENREYIKNHSALKRKASSKKKKK